MTVCARERRPPPPAVVHRPADRDRHRGGGECNTGTLARTAPACRATTKHFIRPLAAADRRLEAATPQKAAGRMTEPPVWLPSASGNMPAATAAAEPTTIRQACGHDCVDCVWRGLERGELGGDGLAQDEPARALDQHDHRRVGLRLVAGIDRRAVRGGQFRRVEDVFHTDGKPAQRQARVRLFGALPCRTSIRRGEGADVALVRGDGLGAELDHGARSKVPASIRRASSSAESISTGRRSARRSARAAGVRAE